MLLALKIIVKMQNIQKDIFFLTLSLTTTRDLTIREERLFPYQHYFNSLYKIMF